MNDRHPVLASFATLFLVPMTLLILIFSAFELRLPLVVIKSPLLRWLVEYKHLYARYEHAVMSWDNVFFFGLILALSALVLESFLRRYQGNVSVGFHTAMAFLVALCSFWAVGDFHFSRHAHIALSRSPENWLASKYAVIVIYSSLKNATLYAAVCWIVCRLTRKMNHCTHHRTPIRLRLRGPEAAKNHGDKLAAHNRRQGTLSRPCCGAWKKKP